MSFRHSSVRWACLLAVVASSSAYAQPNQNVENRAVNIWSDGTRLSGNLFSPKDKAEGTKLPAILLCHGWGGVKSHLNQTYAPKFAAAGYYVLTFDYRGWGESDSRLVVKGEMPKPDANGQVAVTAQAVRELVNPFNQLEDIQAALNFLEGEPGVDTSKIGLWGTSFGGGLVTYTAAHDPRVKCVVSQVGAQDLRPTATPTGDAVNGIKAAHESEIKRARGDKAPVPQGEDVVEGLRGTPHTDKFAKYAPITFADDINVPVFFIDAEKEELMDITKQSGLFYEKLKGRLGDKVKYHIEPGITHYGTYRERYAAGSDMALEWFNTHLK